MRYCIAIWMLFSVFAGFSQYKSLIESKEFARSKTEAFNGFIGENDLSVFTVDYIYTSKKKKSLIVRKFYKSDLSLMEEKDIFDNPLENYNNEPYEIYLVKDKIYLFSIFTHNKEGNSSIGLFIFNENMQQQSFEIVDTIERLSETNIFIQLSEDENAFVISQNHPHKLTHKEAVNLMCLDLYGDEVWKKELISLNDIHKVNVEKVIFPNKTEVFLLCNYGFNNNTQGNVDDIKLLSNKYSVWVYNNDLNFLKEIDLRLKLKWLNGVNMILKENGHIVVAGYVNSSRTFGINAFFNIEIDRKYEVIQNNYSRMDKELMSLFLPKDSRKKLLENFFLRQILLQNDGSFYVIGEHYYKYLDRVYDPRTNTTNTTEHFNYEYIIAAYFNPQGEIVWAKRIPKLQNSTNDFGYYSSFTTFNSKNEVYLIYNDYNKNLEISIDNVEDLKAIFNGRKNALVYVKINAEGPVFRKQIPNSNNYLLYAKKSLQIGDNSMYLLTELGRKSKIISMDF